MKCLTLVSSVLALTAAVTAAPYALRQAARPSGPPPLKAKLLAYVAGTETPFGVISANGTLVPTSTPPQHNLPGIPLPPVPEADEPVFTLTYTPTKRATIFAASVTGPEGTCAVSAEGLLDCTQAATTEGVRVESTVYGWELDVNGDWWWYENPPVDRTAPRVVHASYGEIKGQAPFQIMVVPVVASA
ncbi:hypothetical protein AURDEDRAFT_113313 [Auricularia subglabra TFB-10046 SS5]|nr:hypothetical protein AURDEDRAFT_113313 [Auricularia subglabra TFB-10046 SS5]